MSDTQKKGKDGLENTKKILKTLWGAAKELVSLPFEAIKWVAKGVNTQLLVLLAAIGIGTYCLKPSNTENQDKPPRAKDPIVAKVQGQSAYGKQKQNGEPAWDHPDKTRAEYYQEGRLTTSQLYEDTLIDQDLSPTPLKLSPITKIRQQLSIAVSNGANYDKVADTELYIQDKTDPNNVIAFGLGVMQNGFNKERAAVLATTMPSCLNGESRSMEGTRFNLQLGNQYRFGIEVLAGTESDQIRITYPFEECPTFKTEQHNGRIVVFSNDGSQPEKASEGQTDEVIKTLEDMSFNKSPNEIVWMNGNEGPVLNQITPEKKSTSSNVTTEMALKRTLNGR